MTSVAIGGQVLEENETETVFGRSSGPAYPLLDPSRPLGLGVAPLRSDPGPNAESTFHKPGPPATRRRRARTLVASEATVQSRLWPVRRIGTRGSPLPVPDAFTRRPS